MTALVPTEEQRTIYEVAKRDPYSILIDALAGSGKTTSLIEVLRVLPQASSLVLAFNKAIADTMLARKPPTPRSRVVHVRTLHAAGLWVTQSHFPHLKVDKDSTERLIGRFAGHASLRVRGATLKLLRLVKDFQHAVELDLDYAYLLATEFGVFDKLDGPEAQQAVEITGRAYAASLQSLERDAIDYPDMGWLPLVLGLEPPSRYRAILLDEAQDVNANQIAMVERLLVPGGRIIACGDLHQCHPAGTMIEVTGGARVPIERIEAGMQLVSYHDLFRGLAYQGRKVLTTRARPYSGELITIEAGGETVRVTPNHRVPTRFVQDDRPRWALYLMEYGKTSRLGCCSLFYQTSFGPSMRARHEGADRCWVLQVFDDGDEAVIAETLASVRFGIPEHVFKEKGAYKQRLLDALGDNSDRAARCLEDFGRRYDHPAYVKGEGKHFARNYSYVTEACNLLDGLNQVRTFAGSSAGGSWAPVALKREKFSGDVYSLSVEPTEGGLKLYVADRILVHNSIYGWRGATGDAVWDLLSVKYKAMPLPLTITWRCDHAIVREAQTYVPALRARPGAGPGIVDEAAEADMMKQLMQSGPEDGGSIYVLSRNNAELLRVSLELWRRNVPFNTTQGYETLGPLRDALRKVCKGPAENELSSFIQGVAAWYGTEMIKATAAGSSTWADRIEEQRLMMLYCAKYVSRPRDIERLLETIFAYDATCWITLSTVHKAKGLEADHVYLLKQTFAQFQDRTAPDGSEIEIPEEEDHVIYVAITRAKKHLTWVSIARG